jgi:hypothetical protein
MKNRPLFVNLHFGLCFIFMMHSFTDFSPPVGHELMIVMAIVTLISCAHFNSSVASFDVGGGLTHVNAPLRTLTLAIEMKRRLAA